jgi:hypothetical protein
LENSFKDKQEVIDAKISLIQIKKKKIAELQAIISQKLRNSDDENQISH